MRDDWIKRLINPQTMQGLYDDEPSLQDFELGELSLDKRGPSCLICGTMARFPDHPRPTWEAEADRLEIRFTLSAVDSFSARGSVAGGAVDLSVEPAEDGFGVVVRGEGEDFEFEVAGIGLQIIGMMPYIEEEQQLVLDSGNTYVFPKSST